LHHPPAIAAAIAACDGDADIADDDAAADADDDNADDDSADDADDKFATNGDEGARSDIEGDMAFIAAAIAAGDADARLGYIGDDAAPFRPP
jgi:hypothetical protein